MGSFFKEINNLIEKGYIKISEHGYDELANDDLTVKELLNSIEYAIVVEEYPNYPKGKCILLLQKDQSGNPVHALWGVPKGYKKPVVLITAYRPDPKRWDEKFLERKNRK